MTIPTWLTEVDGHYEGPPVDAVICACGWWHESAQADMQLRLRSHALADHDDNDTSVTGYWMPAWSQIVSNGPPLDLGIIRDNSLVAPENATTPRAGHP